MSSFKATTISSESLKLVEDENSKLQGAIDELETSINKTLKEQKNEIEITHQKALKEAEEQIEQHSRENARLEDDIANNQRACQLEIERDWYKTEALHLDEVLEKKKTEIKSLSMKLETLAQDKECLKAEIDKLASHNTALENKFKELGVNDVELAEKKEEDMNTKEKPIAKEQSEDILVQDAVDTIEFVMVEKAKDKADDGKEDYDASNVENKDKAPVV